MNPAISGLHHVAVQSTDLEAAERFYGNLLGLSVKTRWPADDGSTRAVWLEAGDGCFLALERAASGALPAGQGRVFFDGHAGWHLLALRIDAKDRGAWEQRFADAGVEIEHRSRWTLYVRDPDGNRVGLSHHPEDPVA